ncbi:unnamed protein product, partial [Linum tenue]
THPKKKKKKKERKKEKGQRPFLLLISSLPSSVQELVNGKASRRHPSVDFPSPFLCTGSGKKERTEERRRKWRERRRVSMPELMTTATKVVGVGAGEIQRKRGSETSIGRRRCERKGEEGRREP